MGASSSASAARSTSRTSTAWRHRSTMRSRTRGTSSIDLTAIDFIDSRGLRLLKRVSTAVAGRDGTLARRRSGELHRPQRARHDRHESGADGSRRGLARRVTAGEYTLDRASGCTCRNGDHRFERACRGRRRKPGRGALQSVGGAERRGHEPGDEGEPAAVPGPAREVAGARADGLSGPGLDLRQARGDHGERQGGQGPHHDHDRAGWGACRARERDRDDTGDPVPDPGEPRADRREQLGPAECLRHGDPARVLDCADGAPGSGRAA